VVAGGEIANRTDVRSDKLTHSEQIDFLFRPHSATGRGEWSIAAFPLAVTMSIIRSRSRSSRSDTPRSNTSSSISNTILSRSEVIRSITMNSSMRISSSSRLISISSIRKRSGGSFNSSRCISSITLNNNRRSISRSCDKRSISSWRAEVSIGRSSTITAGLWVVSATTFRGTAREPGRPRRTLRIASGEAPMRAGEAEAEAGALRPHQQRWESPS